MKQEQVINDLYSLSKVMAASAQAHLLGQMSHFTRIDIMVKMHGLRSPLSTKVADQAHSRALEQVYNMIWSDMRTGPYDEINRLDNLLYTKLRDHVGYHERFSHEVDDTIYDRVVEQAYYSVLDQTALLACINK